MDDALRTQLDYFHSLSDRLVDAQESFIRTLTIASEDAHQGIVERHVELRSELNELVRLWVERHVPNYALRFYPQLLGNILRDDVDEPNFAEHA